MSTATTGRLDRGVAFIADPAAFTATEFEDIYLDLCSASLTLGLFQGDLVRGMAVADLARAVLEARQALAA